MATATSYIQDDTGTYIPATQRPDGSWRKARRVKDGYIPQEEMPLYESKGKQWAKSKPTFPVGLDPSYDISVPVKNTPRKIPGLGDVTSNEFITKTSKKKKKKGDSSKTNVTTQMANLNISLSQPLKEAKTETTTNSQPVATDPAKRIRNLRKKLRDINALKLKIESGELKNPDKDQLEKITRKEEIEEEIEDLERQIENS